MTNSAQETQAVAAKMATTIISRPLPEHSATIIGLTGELGAGKTTFVQGFTQALGITEKVKSPTFLLIKQYDIGQHRLYHIDCYRVNDYKELLPLEIEAILREPVNIVLIEWAERIAPILPSSYISIRLEHVGEDKRKISISP